MAVVEAVPGGESSSGPGVLVPGIGKRNGVNCCVCAWVGGGRGGGELADVDPTEPGSLKPCVLLSSGVSKKLRLNSEPASKTTSGAILSGDGALPRLPLKDWSILKTSMMQATKEEEEEQRCVLPTHTSLPLQLPIPLVLFSWLSSSSSNTSFTVRSNVFIILRTCYARVITCHNRWSQRCRNTFASRTDAA
ncbi:hypothetical protein QE152_g8476 [Popillia japonica]|uniref:Uncharacterized protein n=1 Tax=Popillia japonica TaxID=7064 RepID=A0AAW1MB75_POPJA